jgi:YtfJ family uncharacterized protein
MRTCLVVMMAAILASTSVMAHNLSLDKPVAAVGVNDKGELLLQQDKFSYRSWNSAQLSGKVRVIQAIAGRSSAKEMNAGLIEAIKAAKFPHDRYQTTTIINTDDAIPGTGIFVRSSVQSSKQQFPWSQFIVDSEGYVQKAWRLQQSSSAIVVLDKTGKVRFVHDGALSLQQVQQVMSLLRTLLQD